MSAPIEAKIQSTRAHIEAAGTMRANGLRTMLAGVTEAVATSAVAPFIPQIGEAIHATIVPVEWGISTGAVDLGLLALALAATAKGAVNVLNGARDFLQGTTLLQPQAIQAQHDAFVAEQQFIKEALAREKAREADYNQIGGVY